MYACDVSTVARRAKVEGGLAGRTRTSSLITAAFSSDVRVLATFAGLVLALAVAWAVQ